MDSAISPWTKKPDKKGKALSKLINLTKDINSNNKLNKVCSHKKRNMEVMSHESSENLKTVKSFGNFSNKMIRSQTGSFSNTVRSSQ